jgi:hypothetical protein
MKTIRPAMQRKQMKTTEPVTMGAFLKAGLILSLVVFIGLAVLSVFVMGVSWWVGFIVGIAIETFNNGREAWTTL